MAKDSPDKIVLNGENNVVIYDGNAGTAISSAGHFVQYDPNGKFILVSEGRKRIVPIIVTEHFTDNKSIKDGYVADESIKVAVLGSGAKVQAVVKANATAIAVGDPVAVTNTGTIAKANADTDYVLGTALQALDNSASSDDAFCTILIA